VNVLAEEAALAALADQDHARESFEYVVREREWLIGKLSALPGIEALRSEANFVYAKLPYAARRLCEYLMGHKILIRNCAGWPGLNEEAVRIAVRTRKENQRLLSAWSSFPCD
jgi:threonine-phosphate decarboxylase